MAEPLGVTSSIIAIVQITKEIVALAKENIHTTDHARSVLSSLLGRLITYKGIFEGLQLQAESHESDAARLFALDFVGGPLQACKESLESIKSALQKPRGKLWIGKVPSKDITRGLEKLDQLRPVLQTALEADQRVILMAVEDYVRNFSQDLRKLQNISEDIQESVNSSMNNQDTWREEVTAIRRAEEYSLKRETILNWISTSDQESRYRILIDAHHTGTNEWFMKSHDFTEWSTCNLKNLWLYGIMGSGKSVHSALIIKYLRQTRKQTMDETKALGYYYFDANEDDNHSISGFLSSFIKQLSSDFVELPKAIEDLYEKHQVQGHRSCSSIKQEYLIRTLTEIMDLRSATYVVLDAIDELPETDIYKLFDILEQLSTRTSPKLHFLCTSRPTRVISDEVTRLGWRTTTLDRGETDKDIFKYVEDYLKSERTFSRLGSGLQRAISSKILRGTQGMFLMASLQLKRLEKVIGKGSREKDILPILESWPQGVFGVYEKMLSDTPQTCQEELRRALLLVCFSKVPVTLAETAEFAAFKPGNSAPSFADRFGSPEDILLLSGSFFTNSQTRLFLSHHSIQEYLLSDSIKAGPARFFALDEDIAAETIFHTSLAYLKFLHAENAPASYELLPSNVHSFGHSSAQRLKHDYPLANLSSLQFISAPPVYLERHKDDVEFVLTSQKCLTYGFWWIFRGQEASRNPQLNREPASGSAGPLRVKLLVTSRLASSLLGLYAPPWQLSGRAGDDFQQLVSSPSGFPLSTGPHPHDGAILPMQDILPNIPDHTNPPMPRLNYTLLALGMLLVELGCSRTSESFETLSLENLRDMVVPRSISTSTESLFSQASKVIRFCLSPSRTYSMTMEDIRESLYQYVIQPLEDLLCVDDAFDQNMRLLELAEVPEYVSAGISRIQEASYIVHPERQLITQLGD